jgi:hypothetical protein
MISEYRVCHHDVSRDVGVHDVVLQKLEIRHFYEVTFA